MAVSPEADAVGCSHRWPLVIAALLSAIAPTLLAQSWEALPLVTQAQRNSGNSGGEGCQVCLALAADATGNFLLMGTDVGGIYRSVNGGTNWSPCNVGYKPRGDSSAAEPNDNGEFTFTRSGNTNTDVVVNFILSGTASSGVDYQNVGNTMTIPAGQTTAIKTVSVIDDGITEGSETVILTLNSGTGYTVGSPSNVTVNIADEHPLPQMDIVSGGDTVTVFWPTHGAADFTLQQNTNLVTGVWTRLTNVLMINATNFFVTQPVWGASRYFRLAR